MTKRMLIGLLGLILLVSGCSALHPFDLDQIKDKQGIRLLKIEHVKQAKNGYCGVACLEEVAGYWGKSVRQQEIWDSITKGKKKEVIAKELKEYAELQGLKGFIFKGNRNDIYTNIENGRPLIIAHESTGFFGKLIGHKIYHYVVVIGYNKIHDYLIIDDPANERSWIVTDDFNEMWASGYNFLLLVAPEEKGGE